MLVDDRCGIMTELAADFVEVMLTLDPAQRPSISKALQHWWLRDVYKAEDYSECHRFDAKFEKNPMLKTQFGMRHEMVLEIKRIHQWARAHSELFEK